jgi:hypothetical protein
MARLKSRYRQYAAGGAVQAEPPVASPDVVMSIDTDTALSGDDPSDALQKQINALRNSEQIQRQQSEHATQVARLTALIGQNPDMIQNPMLLQMAANEVEREGHNLPLHSDEFFHKVKANFEGRMRRLNEPDDLPLKPSIEPAPKFFEVPEPKPRSNPSMYSAPVSREVPGSSREATEIASGRASSRVTLSIEQKDMARRLGQTEREYAEGLLELRRRKSEGFYDR